MAAGGAGNAGGRGLVSYRPANFIRAFILLLFFFMNLKVTENVSRRSLSCPILSRGHGVYLVYFTGRLSGGAPAR